MPAPRRRGQWTTSGSSSGLIVFCMCCAFAPTTSPLTPSEGHTLAYPRIVPHGPDGAKWEGSMCERFDTATCFIPHQGDYQVVVIWVDCPLAVRLLVVPFAEDRMPVSRVLFMCMGAPHMLRRYQQSMEGRQAHPFFHVGRGVESTC